MACPKCGCKETYTYVEDDILGLPDDQERCAACGHIFYFDDHAEEDDDEMYAASPAPTFRADEVSASELVFPDRYELPRCNGCGHLLHTGECVGVATPNAEVTGLPLAAGPVD